MLELILGGARSGKSRYAQLCAHDSGKEIIFIATARAQDEEMRARISRHRRDRPESWKTVEEPLALASSVQQYSSTERCLLIDCLTLWLSNTLFDEQGKVQEAQYRYQRQAFLDVLPSLPGPAYFVSNEVGMGVIPENALARRFVDEAGRLHQDLGRICQRVTWVVAGLPITVKGEQA